MSILEQARRDLARARSEASKAQQTFKAAVAKLRDAELRVQKLEITQIEWEAEQAALQQRRARAASR
jgi:ATP phosphoribosyltransferase regulatory subunit HisZ